jgi:methionyl aminopeptidase
VIELKTAGEIDAIAAAGRVVGNVLAALRGKAAPGVRPVDLDELARDMIADAAFSCVVGPADPADLALVDATERALHAGIAAAVPGHRLGDVSNAIAGVGRGSRFGMLAGHGGHGVGRSMHEAPFVPNEGRAGRGLTLRPGLVLAIEPMLIAGGHDGYRHDPDGWTLRTADGSRAAHVEHTIAVTPDGPRILTAAS